MKILLLIASCLVAVPALGAAATPSLNTILANCTSGCVLHLPSGIYPLQTAFTPLLIGNSNVTLDCEPGAIIQAQTGFSSGFPEMDITGSNITISGCTFDANGIAGNGPRVDTAASNVFLDHIECKNALNPCVAGLLRTGGPLHLTNSFIHNNPNGGFYDFVRIGGTPSAIVQNNKFDSNTGIAIGSSGLNYF